MSRRTNPDHKYVLTYRPSCSCGWIAAGSHWSRSDAAAEWRKHRERCEQEAGQ